MATGNQRDDDKDDDVGEWKQIKSQAQCNLKTLQEIECKLSASKRKPLLFAGNMRRLVHENEELSNKVIELQSSNAELKTLLENGAGLAKAHLKIKHAKDQLEQQYFELEKRYEKLQDMYDDRVAQIEEQDMIIQRLNEQIALLQQPDHRWSPPS